MYSSLLSNHPVGVASLAPHYIDPATAPHGAYTAETQRCYAHFTQMVTAAAERHKVYLQSQELTIADCYHLCFNYAKAHFQIAPSLPHPLYEELRQCYMASFALNLGK